MTKHAVLALSAASACALIIAGTTVPSAQAQGSNNEAMTPASAASLSVSISQTSQTVSNGTQVAWTVSSNGAYTISFDYGDGGSTGWSYPSPPGSRTHSVNHTFSTCTSTTFTQTATAYGSAGHVSATSHVRVNASGGC